MLEAGLGGGGGPARDSGALNFAFGTDDYLTEKVAEYRKAVAARRRSGGRRTTSSRARRRRWCCADDRKACQYGMRGGGFFGADLARYYLGGRAARTARLDVPRDFLPGPDLRDGHGATATRRVAHRWRRSWAIPSARARAVERFADVGVDELILVMQMGTVPHELVMESLRTFAEKVMPHF